MDKAEERAEYIANGIMMSVQANKYGTVVYNTGRNDFNHSHLKMAARRGYEAAKKDIGELLTIEDVYLICSIENDLILGDPHKDSFPTAEEFYEELLYRFRERKNKQ